MQFAPYLYILTRLMGCMLLINPISAIAELNIQHDLHSTDIKSNYPELKSDPVPIMTNATSSNDSSNINTAQSTQDIFEIINLAQGRSIDLLMNQYQDCFQIDTEYEVNEVLNANVKITIYEKHDSFKKQDRNCVGHPNTSPRVATYFIDEYGRIFKYNVANITHDLQYKFNETPVLVTDLSTFNHPTRAIFDKYGIKIRYLEKRADNTFVIFYVDNTPFLPLNHEDAKRLSYTHMWLFNQLLEANGSWDFMIRTEEGGEYFIRGGRRKVIDMSDYRVN